MHLPTGTVVPIEYRCIDRTWFKVLWNSPESASYNGAFRALEASMLASERLENEPLTSWARVLSFYRVGTGR